MTVPMRRRICIFARSFTYGKTMNTILARPFATIFARDAAIVALASAVLALSAQVAVTLPFSAVPVTMQTLAVLLLGVFLGPKRAASAVALYLVEGMAGLPVFAHGMNAAAFVGPTGGFLLGFVPMAYAAGFVAERYRAGGSLAALCFGLLAAHAALFACGLPWLAAFVGVESAVAGGLLPFVIGDVAKVAVAVGVASLRR